MIKFKLWKLILLEFVLVMPQFCSGQGDPEPPTTQAISEAPATQGVPASEVAGETKVPAVAKESPAPAKVAPTTPTAGVPSVPAVTELSNTPRTPAVQKVPVIPVSEVAGETKVPAVAKEALAPAKELPAAQVAATPPVAPGVPSREKQMIGAIPSAKPEPKKPSMAGKAPAPKVSGAAVTPVKAAVVKKAEVSGAPVVPGAFPQAEKVQMPEQPAIEKSKEAPTFMKLEHVPTIEEKNKEAEKAFIEWKVSDSYSGLSSQLREALTPDAIAYIVEEAEVPFTGVLNEDELEQHVAKVTDNFIKTFDPEGKGKLNRRELFALLKEVVEPQHVFQMKLKPTYFLDKLYNSFLKVLQKHITPINTTLQEWALRFLTADSILVALPIIEAVDVDGKSFSQLTPQEKKRELQRAVNLVAQRFLTNLAAVQEKSGIAMPGRMDEALKYKIAKFLHEKFISIMD